MRQVIIPSIVAKDQKELNFLLKRMQGVSSRVHLDIVDGKFAPNHSLDFKFRLRKNFKYSMHLMEEHPEEWVQKYHHSVDIFIPQLEEIHHPLQYILWCKRQKKKIALALKPETGIRSVKPFIKDLDYVLILTVHPGFYGRTFLPDPLKKIKPLRD